MQDVAKTAAANALSAIFCRVVMTLPQLSQG
jgi:hypothetical protein